MTQGEGISLLLRGHEASSRDAYLQVAGDAFQAFLHPVENGGIVAYDHDGLPFLEEFPHRHPYSHVLNGFIYALWGVYDFSRYTRDGNAEHLYEQGLESLKIALESYDVGFWSRYDLFPSRLINVASPFYHQLHIAQLEALWFICRLPEFRAVALRWRSYQRSRPSVVRATLLKGLYKVVYG